MTPLDVTDCCQVIWQSSSMRLRPAPSQPAVQQYSGTICQAVPACTHQQDQQLWLALEGQGLVCLGALADG